MKYFVKDANTFSIFFPICNDIILHKVFNTQNSFNRIYHLDNDDYGNDYLLSYRSGRSGIVISLNKEKEVERINFSYGATMPVEWELIGINWDISYKDLWLLMDRYGFKNIVTKAPKVNYGSIGEYFEAEFISISNDNSFIITFNFNYRKGKTILDKSTLWGIIIQ